MQTEAFTPYLPGDVPCTRPNPPSGRLSLFEGSFLVALGAIPSDAGTLRNEALRPLRTRIAYHPPLFPVVVGLLPVPWAPSQMVHSCIGRILGLRPEFEGDRGPLRIREKGLVGQGRTQFLLIENWSVRLRVDRVGLQATRMTG